MDNLTHSLVAATLGRTGLSKKVPGGTFSLIAAANLADLDVVSSFWGQLYYLTHHRGITHSILGTFGLATILVGVLWLIGRSRGHPASLGQISLSIYLAAATHPLLDLTNSYGLRPLLPFRDRWFYGDLVFIIDPYLWLILGGAVFLTADRGRFGKAAWLIGTALASGILLMAALSFGLWVPFGIWLAGLGALLFLKSRGGKFPVSLATGALGAVVAYWAFLGAIHGLTLKASYPEVESRYPGISREAISATPRPANPFEWDLFVETPDHVAYARTFSFAAEDLDFQAIPRNRDHPAATAAAATCPGAAFTHFARFPVFDVSKANNGSVVTIEDVRFTRLGRSGDFGKITINLDAPGKTPCPGDRPASKTVPGLQTSKTPGSGGLHHTAD